MRNRPEPEVAAVADRAFRHGFKMFEVVRESGVNRITWARLVDGGATTTTTLHRLNSALDRLISLDEGETDNGAEANT